MSRQAIYWHFPHYGNPGGRPGAAVRSGNWKLIESFEDESFELYNLAEDAGEQSDLVASNPQKVTELRDMLHAWQLEVNAQFPERAGTIERWWREFLTLF